MGDVQRRGLRSCCPAGETVNTGCRDLMETRIHDAAPPCPCQAAIRRFLQEEVSLGDSIQLRHCIGESNCGIQRSIDCRYDVIVSEDRLVTVAGRSNARLAIDRGRARRATRCVDFISDATERLVHILACRARDAHITDDWIRALAKRTAWIQEYGVRSGID